MTDIDARDESRDERASARRSARRAEVGRAAELAALCGFVFVQPVLELFGRSPDVFLFRGATSGTVVAFGLVVAVAPVLMVTALAAATTKLGPRARAGVQVGLIAVLVALFAVVALETVADLPAPVVTACALVAGVAAARARMRTTWFATWLRFAAPAPAVFLAAFLFVAPVSALVMGDDPEAVAVEADGDLPPVVMLVFDEVPTASLLAADGSVDAALFPGFARLAATSTWYRQFTTNSNQTWHALPSMLTGNYPARDTAPVARYHPHNLFTLLGGVYDFRAGEAITGLCPPSVCADATSNTARGLRGLLDDAVAVWRAKATPGESREQVSASFVEATEKRAADDAATFAPQIDWDDAFANTPERFDQFLAGMGPSATRDRPFDFLHVLLPHEPWRFYPSGVEYASPSDGVGRVAGGDTWEDSERATELGRQRHLLQLQYSDRLLGVVLDRLEASGALDRTLVLVTADHGIGFRPGLAARALDAGAFAEATLPELAYAPLFVKTPGQRGGEVDDRDVQLIDILPTVADLVGVEVPWAVDGRSALAAGAPRDRVMIKSTSGSFGPTPAAPLTWDAQRWGPLVQDYASGRFVGAEADAARGAEGLAIYRAGEYGGLVGARIEDLEVAAADADADAAQGAVRSATIDGAGRFDAVDPTSGSLPGLVTGALDAGAPATVAVVLDGRVAGVSATFTDRGRASSFAAILPEGFFRAGRNEVTLYLVTGPPTAPVLRSTNL